MLLVGTLAPNMVAADSLAPQGVELVSKTNVYEGCKSRMDPPDGHFFTPGYETEPHIAINPTNKKNLIAGWMQDTNFGAKANAAAYSFDAGRSWTPTQIPGLTATCQAEGGSADGQADPWISIGPDGIAYFVSSNGYGLDRPGNTVALTVTTSKDGGKTWSHPHIVSGPLGPTGPTRIDDRAAILADPRVPGTAYMTWWRFHWTGLVSELMFSKTRDGGNTWSEPARIGLPEPFPKAVASSQPVVHPDGRLVVVYTIFELDKNIQPLNGTFYSRSSPDGGETWAPPSKIADFPQTYVRDPEDKNNARVRAPAGVGIAAIDAKGKIYFAWSHYYSFDHGDIRMSTSTDAGASWSSPHAIVEPPPEAPFLPFHPTIAAGNEGLGLTWYDTRNDTSGDGVVTTQFWFAHSHDGGVSWEETKVAGPFDLRGAKNPDGDEYFEYRLADYIGLVPEGARFLAIFVLSRPLTPEAPAINGKTDVFFARLSG